MITLARPFLDEREYEAVRDVMKSGWLMQGEMVRGLEDELARLCGCREAVVVASGTAALHILALALDIGAADTVIVPSFAWPSAVNVAALCGATVVLIDSSDKDFNLDCDDLRRKIDAAVAGGLKPTTLIPVHQFGIPCDMGNVMAIAKEYALTIVEDSACALGSSMDGRHLGTFGLAGLFSFHPRKLITTGEGGAIITDDARLAEQCRALRNHGNLQQPGLNYRMTDIQAAIGRVQLQKLTEIKELRNRLIRKYAELLPHISGLTLPDYLPTRDWSDRHDVSLQTLMVCLDGALDREAVILLLAQAGIQAGIGSVAAHNLAAFRDGSAELMACPVADRLARSGLALPLHAGMSLDDVNTVCDALATAIKSAGTG